MIAQDPAQAPNELTPPAETGRGRWFDGLGTRLAILLAIALMPLLVISVLQSMSVLREAQARSEAALMGDTMRAVAGETRLIQQAQSAAGVIANMILPFVGDLETCNLEMAALARQNPEYSLVAFVPPDGIMRCSSTGRDYDFNAEPTYQRIADAVEPVFFVNRTAPVSGTSVMGVTHPVIGPKGEYLGFVAISIPHMTLALIESSSAPEVERPLVIMTFDREGNILTSSGGLDAAAGQLPENRALAALVGADSVTFKARSVEGPERLYSIVELAPNELYALGSWPVTAAASLGPFADISPLLFPTLMWAGSLFVAYFAMERLVIGNIRRLARDMSGFASGNRILSAASFSHAPRELRELTDSYARMTETILHDEAELEDMVHHKEVLLREVHHRVKNNLQLIASIINMQIRQARSPESKALMKGLQDRVISLATIHRGLYQTTGLTDILASELLPDIVRQITRLGTGPGNRIAVDCEIAPIHLTPDQAVPLALFLTEAMTNALKYGASADDAPRISVSLRRVEENRAEIIIRNTIAPASATRPEIDGTGLGSQLINAFVQQVGGKLVSEQTDTHYTVSTQFDLRPLAESEARHQEQVS